MMTGKTTERTRITQDVINDTIWHWTHSRKGEPLISRKDIEDLFDVSDRQALRIRETQQRLSIEHFLKLAQLAGERGDMVAIDLILPEGYRIVKTELMPINDDIDDELGQDIELLGKIHELYKKNTKESLMEALTFCRQCSVVGDSMEAEIKNKLKAKK